MTVSKWLLAAGAAGLITVGCSGIANAQPAPKRPNAVRGPMVRQPLLGRLAVILSKLDLSPAQKEQVKGFMQDARAKAKAVREDTSLTPEKRRMRMQEIAKGLREKITGILTPEQKTKLRKLLAAAPGPRPILARWLAVLSKLDLTPAQKGQVQRFAKDAQAKVKIVRESNLPPAQKRLKVQAIEKDLRANVLGILTPAQKEKLKDLLKQLPPPPPAPK